jgi:hypothetical protein
VGTGRGNQFWNKTGDSSISTGDFTPAGLVWFNTAVFTQPAAGTFGTQSRNSLHNPSFWATDASLRKNFAILTGVDRTLPQPAERSARLRAKQGTTGNCNLRSR